jgi:flagellar protein FlaG
MAIEPLGTVMSAQAQPVNAPKPAAQAEKPETSVDSSVQAAAKVDKTTSVVENAKGKSQNNNGTDQEQPSNEQIKKAVEKLNKSMNNSEAVFGIHEATNRVMIKIVDKDTKEVIKELPPEKTLDMIAKAWELAGILVDEKR